MSTARTRFSVAALGAVLALTVAGCGGSSGGKTTVSQGSSGTSNSALCPSGKGSGSVTVGAFNFGESKILANIYADALKACGYSTTVKAVGNREVVEPALEKGDLDLVPEYAGTLTEFLNHKDNGANAAAMATSDLQATMQKLQTLLDKRQLEALKPAAAADQNAFAVSQKLADQAKLETLSDLATYSKTHPVVLGGPPECPQRPFCEPGLKQVYGIQIKNFKSLDAGGPLTKKAIQDGTVDVGLVFSSDGSIKANKLKVLQDDKGLQTVDNIVPVARKKTLDDTMRTVLDNVSAKLDTNTLIDLNEQVDLQRKDPEAVAKSFLQSAGLTS